MMGPRRYTRIRSPENAELICLRIIEGHNLREIATELDCDAGAITHWVATDEAFYEQYIRAKEAQAVAMEAELLEISDDGSNDWMERRGETVLDQEHVQRSRLRIDTRKWLMAKMLPKRYGERVVQEHTGKDGKDLIPTEPEAGKVALAILNLLQTAKPKDE